MSELYHLKRLEVDQIEAASKVAARAYQNDPLYVYLYPDPNERKVKMVNYCEFVILNGILFLDLYITSSNLEGIALWRAYKINNQNIEIQPKEIKRRLRKVKKEINSDHLFIERNRIFTEILSFLENKHVNFPHWELYFIGVDPIYQGNGYASKLIRAKLAEIDNQNLPCYLNTESEKNVSIYKHFGFELVEKKKVPTSNFYVYAMLRKKSKSI